MDSLHIWCLMIQPNPRYIGINCEPCSHSANVSNYTLLPLIRRRQWYHVSNVVTDKSTWVIAIRKIKKEKERRNNEGSIFRNEFFHYIYCGAITAKQRNYIIPNTNEPFKWDLELKLRSYLFPNTTQSSWSLQPYLSHYTQSIHSVVLWSMRGFTGNDFSASYGRSRKIIIDFVELGIQKKLNDE